MNVFKICQLILVGAACAAAGCEQAYRYPYDGAISGPGGTPYRTEVAVALGHDWSVGKSPAELDRLLKPTSVRTDDKGRFHGFFFDLRTRRNPLSDEPAPKLSIVYVWVLRKPLWEEVPVPLDDKMQQSVRPGQRRVDLPLIVVPDKNAGPPRVFLPGVP